MLMPSQVLPQPKAGEENESRKAAARIKRASDLLILIMEVPGTRLFITERAK